ncbi:MAG: deoxyribose-phosphate aldolase [Alphaproteobacteria bacterium]|uniref:Deoxyribose-phosphate aldolase n=1 Tax=Candidatus Nitrobium versatile TaxID=2884831 RepID=A0A953LVB0_9BACT|nr:deoxyribose-phosphate aldolase [Candidatus Nitrobium versatile]
MSAKKRERARPSGSEARPPASPYTPRELARSIDQTLLKPHATEADVIRLCKGAIKYHFHSVCVHPYFIPLCKAILSGYDTKVTTVIGFPLGMSMKNIKVYEAMQAVLYGAQELDTVLNIGAVKSGNWDFVEKEIREVIDASSTALHKVIIETCYLTGEEKRSAAEVAVACGAKFVKTSTGFGGRGATVADVKLLKEVVQDRAEVKASGGIRTLAQAVRFLGAGATRIGTSAGVEIMQEALPQ